MRLLDLPGNGIRAIRNLVRSLRRKGLDYVVLSLEGSYPERASRPAQLPFPLRMLPLFPSAISLEEIQHVAHTVAEDERVQGVLFRIRRIQAGAPTLHTLRRIIMDLRASGKHTVAWLSSADTWDYYLASACHEVIFPPSGRLSVLGLRSEALFLKDTLAIAGIEADLESIAEYKVTPDTFRRSTMTEPHREMLEAILDSHYVELVSAIAEERKLTKPQVQDLIDAMPMRPDEAVEVGLVDAVLYEDQLGQHLGRSDQEQDTNTEKEDLESGTPLVTWEDASKWLRQPIEWTTRRRIGVISLEGMIVPGKSRRMPMPVPLPVEAQAGAETITQALRQAERDHRIAAVILHVDSPGGSSIASDLIWREVRRLTEQKPVVVLMGEQATSGGYYVSAPASHIVARPTTMTGSIGIFGGKFVLGGLYDTLKAGREEVQRGARADLYSEFRPFNHDERQQIRRELGDFYTRFKEVVASGRAMTMREVEEIARGRVWTGEQAREVGLVDELGDFQAALRAAKKLAGLEPEKDYTVVQIIPSGQEVLPRSFPRNTQSDWASLLSSLQNLARERIWALTPWWIRVIG